MTQILRPDQVRDKYGNLFCHGFFTIVDEKHGLAQVIERCISRGPGEWDVVNRRRTGGIISNIRTESNMIIMDTIIGEKEIRFGPVTSNVGGQGLQALRVEGNNIRTTWYGIAGASIGIGACIPQCNDVIYTEYPDDFKMGGAHRAHVDIITPKMVRVIIGIDDTDNEEQGASWVLSLNLGTKCPIGKFIEHKIIQLNPKVPNKTTNCCSTAISFAVTENKIPDLIEYAVDFVREESCSSNTSMAIYTGLYIPKTVKDFGWNCKSTLYEPEDAIQIAESNGIQVINVTGIRGVIGAVAAIGCFELGERSAGIPEDFK